MQRSPSYSLASQSPELQEALQQIDALKSENTALKDQMAAEEANWLLAQNRILETLKAEKSLHNKVKTNLRRVQDEADKQRNMVEQVRSVGKYWSGLWKNRHDFAVNYWKADLKKMTANFEQKLAAQDAELRSVREEAAAQLSRSAEEKSQLMVKMAAIEAKKVEKGLMLQQLGHQFSCREREWRLRASALEDQISDLQRERSVRENHMMNEIQLLMQKYTHLQDVSVMTTKGKTKTKKEGKAKREGKKRLKKERHEERNTEPEKRSKEGKSERDGSEETEEEQ